VAGFADLAAAARGPVSAPHVHGPNCGCDHGPASPLDRTALISARGLWFSRNGRDLVSGVDLDVHAGEVVTLIGPNGAGKTTLVRLLLGIERADRGDVYRTSNARIGYVPQRFDIDRAMPITVDGFLQLGVGVKDGDVERALRDVGAERTRHQQLSKLSGGETQRVLIARALIRDPLLLVLDEPARGVDYVGEADLYDLIDRIRRERGIGVLLISHDLHVVMARSDRVVCLNGHVCCSGKPQAVAQHSEYARLFGPRAAEALAVYTHRHDHHHDISGAPVPDNGKSGTA
jgi:zinc transport system ATP-binding protein